MRLILVRLSALGDIIHTWPLATNLHMHRPDLHLTWVVEEPFRSLVEGHPSVDAVVTVATKRWRKAPFSVDTRAETDSIKTRLRELTPDLTLDSQGTFKSGLITRWTGAPERVGLARPWRRELLPGLSYTRVLPGSKEDHVVATNAALVAAIGGVTPVDTPIPDGRWLLDRSILRFPEFRREKPYAVLLPGAGRPSKVLSVTVLADLGRRLVTHGLSVVAAWGPGEFERTESIAKASNGTIEIAPATTIEQLTVLLGGASLVVGADTGPVHLASSLGVPTIGVFLATDWRRNGPLGRRSAVLSCAKVPERVRPGAARVKPGRLPTAEEIERSVTELLDQG